MENASKALLMAGGILIAILIIGALLLMVNRIGDYQRVQSSSVKDSQLAKFNLDFERYFDDEGILGTDLISLANKIIDYNNRGDQLGVKNSSVNYDIKMALNLDMRGFKEKYGNGAGSMFSSNDPRYTIDGNNRRNALRDMMKLYEDNFTNSDTALLKKLSSIYDTTKSPAENKTVIREELKYINENLYNSGWGLTGNTLDQPSIEQIAHYKEYSEFKSSTFVMDAEPTYNNGQLQTMSFRFDE